MSAMGDSLIATPGRSHLASIVLAAVLTIPAEATARRWPKGKLITSSDRLSDPCGGDEA